MFNIGFPKKIWSLVTIMIEETGVYEFKLICCYDSVNREDPG